MKFRVKLSAFKVSYYQQIFDKLSKKYNIKISERNKGKSEKTYFGDDIRLCFSHKKFLFKIDNNIKISVEFQLLSEDTGEILCSYSFKDKHEKIVSKIFNDMVHFSEHITPKEFLAAEHFIYHINDPTVIQFEIISHELFLFSAQKSIKILLKDFEEVCQISFKDDYSLNATQKRVETDTNVYQYITLNELTVYKKGNFIFAVGIMIRSDGGLLDNQEIYTIEALVPKKDVEKLHAIFNNNFDAIFRQNIPIGGKFTGSLKFIKLKKKITFDDLVLPKKTETQIKKEIFDFFSMEKIYKQSGLPFKRGIALYGPPGTGKTTIAKIIVSTMKETVFWVKAGDINRVNDIDKIFQIARMTKPSIIILEDIDFYTEDRESFTANKIGIATLMANLDGLEENDGICVVLTTNKIEKVEKAIIDRPGRIDVKIKIDTLRKDYIIQLLKNKFKNFKLENEDFSELFPDSIKLTGAQTIELATNIIRYAIAQSPQLSDVVIKNEHILYILNLFKLIEYNKEIGFKAPIRQQLN